MVPPEEPSRTDQATPWFAAPETVAEKGTVWQASTAVDAGVTATATAVAPALTVTVATWSFDASAWLAATTWNVPSAAGALYVPDAVTEPPTAPSCTDHRMPG